MSLSFNNSAANILNTPGFISDVYASIPNAVYVAIGTIFIATDTGSIYQSDGTNWYTIGGGGGGSQDLQSVLDTGNIAEDVGFILYNLANDEFNQQIYSQSTIQSTTVNTTITPGQVQAQINATNQYIRFSFDGIIEFVDLANKNIILDFGSSNANGQNVLLPENSGTIALQNPPTETWDFNNGNYTPGVTANKSVYLENTFTTGGIIELDPLQWNDQLTLEVMATSTAISISLTTINGGALEGASTVNKAGLFYIKYDANTATFFSSHV